MSVKKPTPRQWLLLGAVGVVLVVVGVVLASRPAIGAQSVAAVSPIAFPNTTATTQSRKDPNQAYLSNGRDFVRYDMSKQSAVTVLKSGSLPTVTNIAVSSDDRYLAFQTTGHTPTDSLAPLLRSYSLSPDQPHWWIADLTTSKITPLPNNFSQVFWGSSPQKLYGIENTPTSALYVYDATALTQSIGLQSKELLWAREALGGYLVQRSDVLVKTSGAFDSPTKLLSSVVGTPYASLDGKTVIAEVGSGKNPKVTVLDVATGKTRVLFKKQTLSSVAFSTDGATAFMSLDNGNLYSYKVASHSLKQLSLDKTVVRGKALQAWGDGVLVATDTGMSLVYMNNPPANMDSISKLAKYNTGTPDYSKSPAYWIYFDPRTSKTTITILAAPVSNSTDAALLALTKNGTDPAAMYADRSVPLYLQGAR